MPSGRRGSRSTFIVVLLVLTLGLTAALGWEAQQSARSHRQSAENVLRDYARFAAWELARVARRTVTDEINGELARVQHEIQRRGIEAAVLAAESPGCSTPLARAAFFVPLPDGRPTVGGRPLTPAALAVIDRLVADVRRAPDKHDCPALVIVEGREGLSALAFRIMWDRSGQARSIVGFAADRQMVESIFSRLLRNSPLLPPSLVPAGKNPNDALSIRVTAEDGRELFASSNDWSSYSAANELPADLGKLKLTVALRPDAANRLVIGGLPRERLPLILGLLALTAGLVIVAVVQLRREAELSRLRSDFVSGVSHELRTPLAQIRMFSETLLLGRVRSEMEGRRSLGIIAREAQRLSQLVENVLFFARSERRRPHVTREAARLAPIVSEVVESFAPLAAARQARIAVALDDSVSAEVDAGALRQILVNLLDNAVKYGPAGQTVALGLQLEGDVARLTVDDEGPGVDPRDAGRIWQPFNRLARAEAAATGGAGIGLAIVRQLVELHGGRAWIDHTRAPGARFVVDLPGAWREAKAGAVA